MRLRFPPFAHFAKGLLAGSLAAVVGYLLLSLTAIPALSTGGAMALGLLVGALVGALASGTRIERNLDETTQTVFVGNIAFKASTDEVRKLFSRYGTVRSVRLMTDRNTRRSRGFGFVEMDRKGARAAIKALDGNAFFGRNLRVNAGRKDSERADNG